MIPWLTLSRPADWLRRRRSQPGLEETEPPLDAEAVALVEAHAQSLLGRLSPRDERMLQARLAARPDLAELTRLAEALAAAIHPVSPAATYRAELARRLEARHPAATSPEGLRGRLPRGPLWAWPVAAGVPVMLGLLAFVWLRRHQLISTP